MYLPGAFPAMSLSPVTPWCDSHALQSSAGDEDPVLQARPTSKGWEAGAGLGPSSHTDEPPSPDDALLWPSPSPRLFLPFSQSDGPPSLWQRTNGAPTFQPASLGFPAPRSCGICILYPLHAGQALLHGLGRGDAPWYCHSVAAAQSSLPGT